MKERRPRILVVDDERHIVDFLAMGLKGRGMDVERALDGHGAISAVGEFCPDLIVLDLMLPGLSGIEVCKRQEGAGEERRADPDPERPR
jgi:two-component system OmpR family response regulator